MLRDSEAWRKALAQCLCASSRGVPREDSFAPVDVDVVIVARLNLRQDVCASHRDCALTDVPANVVKEPAKVTLAVAIPIRPVCITVDKANSGRMEGT